MSVHAFAPIDARTYVPHELHGSQRVWAESNCYIDVWIEILHALDLDPYACLPHVLPVDFEGDQWTFFKPSHDDLFSLYGLDVHELNVWRPLIDNARSQLADGRLVLSEVDAFYLPDTAGTDYRTQHTKTTIGIQELDVEAGRLGYFHNGGYYVLQDTDFGAIFRLNVTPDPSYMPFFAELVRLDRRKRLAFATLRQLGAAFELAALYVRWLSKHGESELEGASAAFDAISGCAKMLILKTARAVSTKKPLDASASLSDAERAWQVGIQCLVDRYGG